jgi:hypothetical protein
MPSKRKMKGGARPSASGSAALINVSGTENRATGAIDLHVDSKKSGFQSKMSGGRHTRRARKTKRRSSGKSRRSGRGGSILGTALLPFGLLWGQKAFQNSSSKSSRRKSKSRRRRPRHSRR